jgi:hypothetical protein
VKLLLTAGKCQVLNDAEEDVRFDVVELEPKKK